MLTPARGKFMRFVVRENVMRHVQLNEPGTTRSAKEFILIYSNEEPPAADRMRNGRNGNDL